MRALAAFDAIDPRFGLSPQERLMVAAVVEKPVATRVYITDLIWGHRPDGGVDNPGASIGVMATRIRRKLGAHGINFQTVWGTGYALSVADKRRLLVPSYKLVAA